MRFIILIALFISFALSSSDIEVWKNNVYEDFNISYLEDKNSQFNINDIEKKQFTHTTSNKFTLGRSKGSFWFKIKIKNISEKENFVFTVNESFYEIFELYEEKKHTTGLRQKIQDREIKSNKLAFNLHIPKNQSKTIYIKLKAHFAYFGEFILYEKESFYLNNYLGINSFFIFLFGTLTIIFLFNFFLFLKLKESIYFYYSSYILFLYVYLLNMSGLLAYFDLAHYLYKIQFTGTFATGFFILFSLQFLETKKYLPKIDLIMKIFAGISFIFATLYIFSFQPWAKVTATSNSIFLIILVIVALIITFKDRSKSIYYLFAMSLYLISFYFFATMVEGNFEHNHYTRYGFYYMVFVEVSIFALILSNRYNELKDETIKAQNTLIKMKSENETILENKISQRTKKISSLLDEKELLLKELHHRIKNNFHMIIGILHFESKKENNKNTKNLINRIKSMSTIHEYLYNSKNITKIDTKEYLNEIIQNISSSYPNVKINSQIDKISIDFDSAISLGVIINEVFTNTIKHNKIDENFNVKIKLMKNENDISLNIEDTGKGFEFQSQKKGLGLNIIEQFCDRLKNSEYNFINENGMKFNLLFET